MSGERQSEDAFIDYLTGLSNRRGLYEYYKKLDKTKLLHAIFIDVDNFKRVNDIYGHSVGDNLLVKISDMLQENTDGFVCRMGGDEFVVLLDGDMPKKQVCNTADRYRKLLREIDFRSDVRSIVTFSIGVVLNQSVEQNLDDMLFKCDTAMYQAKYDGKNRCKFYSAIDKNMQFQKTIELEKEAALENDEFVLYLQPKLNMITSQIVGAEALSRWHHPKDGIRMPDTYLPIFEKNGFVSNLNIYIFKKLCETKAQWKGTELEHLPISINISRFHLYDRDFVEKLLAKVKEYDINPAEIEMEIREEIFIQDKKAVSKIIEQLIDNGFLVSIDDYGAEFATLHLLKDISVNSIKLNPHFFKECYKSERGKKVLRYLMNMCLGLRQEIITVGVETKEQTDFILNCGGQVAQGSYYADALTVEKFMNFAKEYTIYSSPEYLFTFNETLKSEEGSLTAEYLGQKAPVYVDTLIAGKKGIYFPGGARFENVVRMPGYLFSSDSYTVSFFVRPEKQHMLTSVFYAAFTTGFASYMPFSWEGHASFRNHLTEEPQNWYDCAGCMLQKDLWFMVTLTYNAKNERAILFINEQVSRILENVPVNRNCLELILGGDNFQESFTGTVFDFHIYNEVKDFQFVKDLYNSYKPLFLY